MDGPEHKRIDLPCDTAAEAAVLGSMIQDPGCIAGVVRLVDRDSFFLAENRAIFEAIRAVGRACTDGDGADGLLVRAELERRKQLEAIGGTAYLKQVVESVPSSANAAYYARIVADRHTRRQTIAAAERLATNAREPSVQIGEELHEARRDLDEILSGEPTGANRDIAIVDAGTWLTAEPPEPDQILADLFDRGDKVAVIGSSKVRKSFFLLQTALSIAAGRKLFGWQVPKPRRVLMVQYEIQASHFHRRVRRMAHAMGLSTGDLAGRVHIVNARGMGLEGESGISAIRDIAGNIGPEIICMDPLYKVATGVENAAEDAKVILAAFDRLAEATGAAIVFVHHDAKGFSGDRDIRDRGAGSNVLGRDYDACIALTPHASETDGAVVEVLLRNYRQREPFTIRWTEDRDTDGYCFQVSSAAPVKQTSANARVNNGPTFEEMQETAEQILKYEAMPIADFKDLAKHACGLSRDRVDEFTRWLLLKAVPPLQVYETRGKGRHHKFIGTKDQIADIQVSEFRTPALNSLSSGVQGIQEAF